MVIRQVLCRVASVSSATHIANIVLSLFFAGVWIYAAVMKIPEPMIFLLDVRSFQILPDPYAAFVAMGLPWLELICGMMVLMRYVFYRAAVTVLLSMLGVFLVALIWAWTRNLDITCGCFGKSDNATSYIEMIVRDLGLIAVGLLMLGTYRSRGERKAVEADNS